VGVEGLLVCFLSTQMRSLEAASNTYKLLQTRKTLQGKVMKQ